MYAIRSYYVFGPGTERLTYGLIAPFSTWALLRSYGERRYRLLTTLAWLMTGLLGTGWVGRKLVPIPTAWPLILPLGVVVFLIWLAVRETGPPAFRVAPPADDP